MKKLKNRWSFLLTVVILCSLLGQYASPLSILAKENTQIVDAESVIWNGGDLPDTDELFAGYVTQEMYAGTKKEIAPFANFGEQRLTGINKTLYQKLKASFEKVANGEESSTIFEIPVSDLEIQTTWTAEELGITTEEKIKDAVNNKLSEQGYDYNVLLDCLLADCPYDLYWYDKTEGTRISSGSYSYSISGGKVTNVSLTGVFQFSMTVVQEYRSSEYETDTAKTAATTTAVNNAKEIVEQYTAQTDYDKLTAYKETICNLVSYNDEAAYDSATPYGDPWQLIWVFDNDASTNVVCEGYSKAFQYLCDLTEFSSDAITCYTVTGDLSGGGHMWNIVTMNDNSHYLVDVTNCDEGTIGAPDKLFLAGLSGSWNTYYSFTSGSKTVTYSYDEDAKSLFGENILTLASSNYQNGSSPDVTVSISGEVSIMTYGDKKNLTATVSGSAAECTYQWSVDGQPVDGATEKTYDLSTLGAGEHNIQVQVKVGAYSFTSPSYLVTVEKYTPMITFNEYSLNYYYTGNPVSAPGTMVTLVNDETYRGNISYSYRKGQNTEWSPGLPTEVGTYYIKVQTEEQDNYNKAETDCQITIAYVPFTSTILYNNTEKQTWYNQSVSISAEGYQVSDSLTGSFSDTYQIAVPKTDGTLEKTLYFKNQNGEISDGQTVTLSFDVSASSTATGESLSNGAVFSEGVLRYRVTNAAKKQAEVIGLSKNVRKVTIPATVRASSTGEQFRVVSIGKKAFKNNKKVKKVVISSSVKRIGKQAFANCKKLNSIIIQTKSLKMNTVGIKAFRGISAKAVIKTPRKKLRLYQKILRKKGVGTGATIR